MNGPNTVSRSAVGPYPWAFSYCGTHISQATRYQADASKSCCFFPVLSVAATRFYTEQPQGNGLMSSSKLYATVFVAFFLDRLL